MAEQLQGDQKLFLHGKPVPADYQEVHEHVSPVSLYVKVLGALFVLTVLTYVVSFADLGPASLTVAMLVATVKATLVCMYFMHLKYDDRYHVFVFLSTMLFVGIFFVFTLFDLGSRDRLNEEQDTFFRMRYDNTVGNQFKARGGIDKYRANHPELSKTPYGSTLPKEGETADGEGSGEPGKDAAPAKNH